MDTILTINGTDYTAAQRAAARINYHELALSRSGYGTLTISETGSPSPTPTWMDWSTFHVKRVSTGVTIFRGVSIEAQSGQSAEGWTHGYAIRDLRWAADKLVPVEALDGTGTVNYNTPPTDVYGSASDRGLTCGTIIQRLLTVPNTATRLNNLGVINYTSLSPPTLPTATQNDLVNLTIVPPQKVSFMGGGIFAQIDAFLARWMPRYAVVLRQDGTLRFLDMTSTTDFTPQTVTLPTRHATGDPIPGWARVRRSSENVANNYKFRGGPDVHAYVLSLLDGTLVEGFSSTDKSTWTYYSFTQPKNALDSGTVTTMTSTSATLRSSDATVTWTANYWSNIQASIFLLNPVATGILVAETETITSCDAMTAGSTAVVHWDSSQPASSSSFTKYRIVGKAGSGIDTWRLYYVCEPDTGATGLNTWIGSHLERKSPRPVYWANVSKTLGEYYTQAVVVGGSPQMSFPLQAEPVPSLGAFRFVQPTVSVFGNPSKLKTGSPTTTADGLPTDVQILALYSKGALTTVYPANDAGGNPTYGGTANAAGIHITQYMDFSSWLNSQDTTDMTSLAREHCLATQDIVYDVSFDWLVGASDALPAWDFLTLNFSLNVALAGTTSPWSAINAPVQSVVVRWTAGPTSTSIQQISFSATTQRKPFTGDDLYTHPAFTYISPLSTLNGGGGMYGTNFMPAPQSDPTMGAIGAAESFASTGLGRMAAESESAMSDLAAFEGDNVSADDGAPSGPKVSEPLRKLARGTRLIEKAEERRQKMEEKAEKLRDVMDNYANTDRDAGDTYDG